MVRLNSSAVTSTARANTELKATFTQMSIGPNSASVRSAAA